MSARWLAKIYMKIKDIDCFCQDVTEKKGCYEYRARMVWRVGGGGLIGSSPKKMLINTGRSLDVYENKENMDKISG